MSKVIEVTVLFIYGIRGLATSAGVRLRAKEMESSYAVWDDEAEEGLYRLTPQFSSRQRRRLTTLVSVVERSQRIGIAVEWRSNRSRILVVTAALVTY